MKKSMMLGLGLVWCVAALLGACGSKSDGGTSSTSSGSSFTCCVNGAFYNCPDAAAQQNCASACSRDSSKDNTCSN
jgi:hypothetical protein